MSCLKKKPKKIKFSDTELITYGDSEPNISEIKTILSQEEIKRSNITLVQLNESPKVARRKESTFNQEENCCPNVNGIK